MHRNALIAALLAASLAACGGAAGTSPSGGAIPIAASNTAVKKHGHPLPHSVNLLRAAVLYKNGVEIYSATAVAGAFAGTNQLTTSAGNLGALGVKATTMYYDTHGNLFVGLNNGNVKAYSWQEVDAAANGTNGQAPVGTFQCSLTQTKPGTAITMDPSGNLYFGSTVSTGNAHVCVFSAANVATALAGGTISKETGALVLSGTPSISGLAADTKGDVYAEGTQGADVFNWTPAKISNALGGLKGVVSTGYLEFGDGPNPICSGAAVVRPIIFDSSGNMIAINAYQVGAGYLSSQLPTTKSGLIPTRWLPSELSYGAVAYDSSGNLFEGLQVTSNGDNIAASTAAQLSTMWTSGGEASFNLGFNGGGNCVTAMSDDTFYNGGLFEVQGGLAEAISSTNLESLVGTGGGNTPVYGNLAVPSGTAALDVLPLRFFQ